MLSTQKLGQKMTRKCREPGKNTNCPAEFSFKISESCASVCKDATNTTHYQKKYYPLEIDLHYNHNNPVDLQMHFVSDL